jgi:hypothetical protein
MGRSLGWAGDIDGDGNDDLLIGAPRSADFSGEALVAVGPWAGVRTMPLAAYVTFVPAEPGRRLGAAVGPAGDANGDGHPDVWVADAGTAYLFHGPLLGEVSTADAAATIQYRGKMNHSGMVSGRDLTGDGVADLLLAGRRRVHLIEGPFSGDAEAEEVARLTLFNSDCDVFGQILDDLGDTDLDGYSELLVGASGTAACRSASQIAVVSAELEGVVDVVRADSATVLTGLAFSAAGAGDVDGDEVPDVVVGRAHKTDVVTVAGPFFEDHRLGEGSDGSRATATRTGIGVRVTATGDLDGDGLGDIVATSIEADSEGGAYWIPGAVGEGELGSTGVRLLTDEHGHADHMSVLAGRDLDGDGVNDVVIGVPTRLDGAGGSVYIVSGSALTALVGVM